jgi:glycosyltransferase involved in cell wall biosynthesis
MNLSSNSPEEVLSVVVPAFNERKTLAAVVEALNRVPRLLEIVVVDDCSTDGTQEEAVRLAGIFPRVRVLRHARNQGKTGALCTGIAATSGDIVIIQDADLEYDPEEIPAVIQPILDGHAEVVFGSRFSVRKATRVLYYYHFLANKFLTFCSNLLTNINLTDVEAGYKAFRGDILRKMRIVSTGFGFEIEVTAKVSKLGCAIYEVPISYYGRTYEEGKKIGFRDGIAALWYIAYFNLFCGLKSSFTSMPDVHPFKVPSSEKEPRP